MRLDFYMAVFHYSDSLDVSAATIDQWHKERGFTPRGSNPLKYIGYHWVVHPDGSVEPGRSLDVQGTHCPGYNLPGILAICNTGSDSEPWYPSKEQYLADVRLIQEQGIPAGSVALHRQLYSTSCPGRFDLGYLISRLQGGASTVNIIDIKQVDLVQHPGAYRGIAIVTPQGVGSTCAFKIKFPPGLFEQPPLLFISQPNSGTNWGASVGTSDVTVDGATVYLIDRGASLDGAIIGLGIMAWTIDS